MKKLGNEVKLASLSLDELDQASGGVDFSSNMNFFGFDTLNSWFGGSSGGSVTGSDNNDRSWVTRGEWTGSEAFRDEGTQDVGPYNSSEGEFNWGF